MPVMRMVTIAPVPRRAMDALESLTIELRSPAVIARAPTIRKKPYVVANPETK